MREKRHSAPYSRKSGLINEAIDSWRNADAISFSPANWTGLAFSLGAIALVIAGFVSARWLGIAALAYGVGFVCGGLWLGWPQLAGPAWDELTFAENDSSRDGAMRALGAIGAS